MRHFVFAAALFGAGLAFVPCMHGQQLSVYLSASFDANSGSAYAYATTTLDYNAGYYYSVCTSINALSEEDNGNQTGYESTTNCGVTDAEVSWSFGIPTDTDYMNFNGIHVEDFDYYAYQMDSGCGYDGYDCNGYWDAYEMSFMGINGQTYGGSEFWYMPGPPPASISQSQVSELTHQEVGTYCFFPRFETSSYSSMENAAQTGYYGGIFSVQVDDFYGFASYWGRTVTESFGPVSSTCWFFGSPYSQPTGGSFTPSTWNVQGNTYSPDYIGWNVPEGNYYQNRLGGSGSCTMFSDSQAMSMSQCHGGPPGKVYDLGHTNSFTIYPSTMFASRASASGRAQ